jgi:general secretion pathway protein D
MAPPQLHEKISGLIGQLDKDNLPKTVSEVVGLKHSEVESTIRTLATIVTGKSGAVQADGGTTGNRATSAGRPAGINAVTTSVNTYRTFSFTNRPAADSSSRNENSWFRSGHSDADASAANPNSFSEYVTVTGDERTNRLIAFGTPEDIAQIKEIIAKTDVPLPQVRIEAVIVEVTLANGEASGLDTLGLGYRAVASAGNVTSPNYNLNAATPTLPGSAAQPFSITGSLRDFSLSVLFGQAERNSRVRILSAPLINTSHNQPATIFVGEEHPVVTSSLNDLSNTSSTRSTIEFKQIGLSLGVTPRVGANGSVEMKVDQSNQSISRTVSVDGNEQPVTANRSASSYLLANNNETIVLAGLQSYHELETKGVMWLLGYIPLLGNFFRPETKDATRTEIIIFLKPHILSAADADVNLLPGIRPGSLTRPDAQSYVNTGRFDAVSLTAEERDIIENIRKRQEADAKATRK